jgi:hypothetical protein
MQKNKYLYSKADILIADHKKEKYTKKYKMRSMQTLTAMTGR